MTEDATFIYVKEGDYYLAYDKNAARVGAIISKMKIRETDFLAIRSKGYRPMLKDGGELGKIRESV